MGPLSVPNLSVSTTIGSILHGQNRFRTLSVRTTLKGQNPLEFRNYDLEFQGEIPLLAHLTLFNSYLTNNSLSLWAMTMPSGGEERQNLQNSTNLTEKLSTKDPKKEPPKLNVYLPIAFALVMIIGMQIGFKLYENLKQKVSPLQYASTFSGTETINEVFNFIEAKYVDTINNPQLVETVIEETLNKLDPHSSYISAAELEDVNESLKGNFDGIGIEFSIVQDTIVVITPIVGGPSEKLGILPGDQIIEIEDTLVAGLDLNTKEVIARLKGKKGSSVKLGIKRNKVAELIPFTITRDKIPLNSLEVGYMLDEEVAYLKLTRFSATTYDEFGRKMLEMHDQGMKKLILDLRQNPGGYLDAATKIADELIGGKNLLVYTEGRNYKRKEYYAKRMGTFEDGELIVLIDQGSASASEILAGAIQDLDRGLLIGRRSFGKGLVQEQHQLSDGSAMRLTVARYFTPSGRSIQKPYKDKDSKAYNDELADRYFNGELFEQDSIKMTDSLKYMTLGGKTVYGGGGITPDIFMPLDTSLSNVDYLKAQGFLPGFIYQHFSHNQDYYLNLKSLESFKNNFKISKEVLAEFSNYLKKEEAKVDFIKLNPFLPILKNNMKAYLARQIWRQEGYYTMMLESDDILAKAYETLKQPSQLSTAN